MARISTYTQDTTITGQDSLIGTDGNNQNNTKIFPVDSLRDYFETNIVGLEGLILSGDIPIVDGDGNVFSSPLGSQAGAALTGTGKNTYLDSLTYNIRLNEQNAELEINASNWVNTRVPTSLIGQTFLAEYGDDNAEVLPRVTKIIGDYLGVRRVTIGGEEIQFLRFALTVAPAAFGLTAAVTDRTITNFRTSGNIDTITLTGLGAGGGGGGSITHAETNEEVLTISGGNFANGELFLAPQVRKIVWNGDAFTSGGATTEGQHDFLYAFYNTNPTEGTQGANLNLPNDATTGTIVRISNLWGREGVRITPGQDGDLTTTEQFIQGVQDFLELDDFRASFELIYTGPGAPGWVVVGGRGGS